MDLYVLDDLLRRTEVIDRFESLIWTERFDAYGDFQLVTNSSPELRDLLYEGARLAINESKRVMVVETIEDKDDSEGRSILTVSGRSLEAILDDRIARDTNINLTSAPRWVVIGTPGDIIRQVFKNSCVDGILDPHDIIPFVTPGTIYPPDNIQEPPNSIYLELEIDTVYNTIRNLCTANGLGFCLVRDGDTSQLHFFVYSGNLRTSVQHTLPPVIFSPGLDSLTNISELVSIETEKNVAYVVSPEDTVVVFADGDATTATGFTRRVLLVKVDSITPSASETGLTNAEILQRRGKEALNQHKRVSAFDGEIPKSGHKYEVDYKLGDVVEIRKSDGIGKYMRVTEQIFVSDAEGDRSYPTLAIDQFIGRFWAS